MKINEIFYSIQGEGKWTGRPNILIRTTGCNLRCAYCDTKYAYKLGKEMEINEILKKISKYKIKNVCITGGEPLLQKDIYKFLNSLQKKGFKISVETNGSIDIKKLLKKDVLISLDIKCPSSKMDKKNDFNNLKLLRKTDQLKFIIKDKKDYSYAKKIIKKYKPKSIIYFQPVWGKNQEKLAEWIISDKLNVRLGLQIHKMLWGEKTRL